MRYKAVIFDMDGLMFDTEKLWQKSFIKTGKELGYNLSKELHNQTMGASRNKVKEILKDYFQDIEVFNKFYNSYLENMDKTIEKEGVKIKKGLNELLDYLIKNKYKIAIASSTHKERIEYYLNITNTNKSIFNEIVSGQDFENGKPNPEIYIKTCQLLKVKPEEAIVLEDSNNGIKAAYGAKCTPILIPDINIVTEETKQMAKYQLNSLLDVIDLLEK